MKRKILFISVMDFTDKGIQVVRKTPEFFSSMGWHVHYLVCRDTSIDGSYAYQNIVEANEIVVHRYSIPLSNISISIANRKIKAAFSHLRCYLAVIKLAFYARMLNRKLDFDIFYGGGSYGILAAHILKLSYFGYQKAKIVSRFYGVWDLCKVIEGRNIWKLFGNMPTILALYFRSNLKIITNDGTRGDLALKMIRPSNAKLLRFYPNGVDRIAFQKDKLKSIRSAMNLDRHFVGICITRLISQKRVDLCIHIAKHIIDIDYTKRFRLVVVGDGVERAALEQLAVTLGISQYVIFLGAVENERARELLAVSDCFFSMYDVSNVGNPLLEAIRANKIIFTLDNGGTPDYIINAKNGFVYNHKDIQPSVIARDVAAIMANESLCERIQRGIEDTDRSLPTWFERLELEYREICRLL